ADGARLAMHPARRVHPQGARLLPRTGAAAELSRAATGWGQLEPIGAEPMPPGAEAAGACAMSEANGIERTTNREPQASGRVTPTGQGANAGRVPRGSAVG